MIVYRFCQKAYSEDTSGNGARLFGGRWNNQGLPALYTSQSISLSLLEVLVNATSLPSLKQLAIMRINVPAFLQTSLYKAENLKPNWQYDFDYTKWIGSEFLQNKKHLLLECPSAVVFEEKNYMINPLHKEFKNLTLVSSSNFAFDDRLFKA